MDYFCHDAQCRGNAVPAGADPEQDCRYCALPLLDEHNCCIIGTETPLSETAQQTDLQSVEVCSETSHHWEGRLLLIGGGKLLLAGRCARCGLGILTAG